MIFFCKSTTSADVLDIKHEILDLLPHKLIHDISDQCNGIYDTLKHYLLQQPAIYSALMDKNVKKNVKD